MIEAAAWWWGDPGFLEQVRVVGKRVGSFLVAVGREAAAVEIGGPDA
jgi:hypothetical protein